MNQSKQSAVSLRDVYRAVCRHKWRAGSFFVFVMIAVTLFTIFSPRTYYSEGKLFVRVGRENATLGPTATLGSEPVVAIPDSRDNEINTVVAMLQSRPLVEQVVETIGPAAILDQQPPAGPGRAGSKSTVARKLDEAKKTIGTLAGKVKDWVEQLSPNPAPPLADRDRAIIEVAQRLRVESVRKSSVIRISYQSHSPDLSRAVVAKVIDAYLDQHVRLNRTGGAHTFFADQASRMREELARKNAQLRDLQNAAGPVSLDGQRKVIVDRIARLEDERFQAESAIAVSGAKVQALRNKLAAAPETEVTSHTEGIGDYGTDDIRAQFYALELQEQDAAAKYTPSHPKMRHIREQIAAARDILNQEPPTRTHVTKGPGQVYQEAQLALLTEEPLLASLEAKRASLRTQLAAARDQWKALNENDLRLAKLQRDVALCETSYRKYATNFEETRIDQALEDERISNINVVQPASYDIKPVRPRKLFNLAFGFLVGVFGGLGLALAADNRDRPFRTPEDVETSLEMPTLASIPRLKRRQLALNGRN